MRFEIDRESDPEIFTEMEGAIESVLGDVRAACEDWLQMRQKAVDACRELELSPPPLLSPLPFSPPLEAACIASVDQIVEALDPS